MSFSELNQSKIRENNLLVYPSNTNAFFSFKKNKKSDLKNEISTAINIIEESGIKNGDLKKFAEFRKKIIPRLKKRQYLLPSDYADLKKYAGLLEKSFDSLAKKTNNPKIESAIISLSSLQLLELMPLVNDNKVENYTKKIQASIRSMEKLSEKYPDIKHLLSIRTECLKQLNDKHVTSLNGLKIVAEYTALFHEVLQKVIAHAAPDSWLNEEVKTLKVLQELELGPLEKRVHEDQRKAAPVILPPVHRDVSGNIRSAVLKLEKVEEKYNGIRKLLEFREYLKDLFYEQNEPENRLKKDVVGLALLPSDLLAIQKYENCFSRAAEDLKALPPKQRAEIEDQLVLLKTLELKPLKKLAERSELGLRKSAQLRSQAAAKGGIFQNTSRVIKAYEKTHKPLFTQSETSNEIFVQPKHQIVIKKYNDAARLEEEKLAENIAAFYLGSGVVPGKEFEALESISRYIEPYDQTLFQRAYRPLNPQDLIVKKIISRLGTDLDSANDQKELWDTLANQNLFKPSTASILSSVFSGSHNVYAISLPDPNNPEQFYFTVEYSFAELQKLYKLGLMPADAYISSRLTGNLAMLFTEVFDHNKSFAQALLYDPVAELQAAPHFLPIPNQEYEECEKIAWNYADRQGNWQPVDFHTLHKLWMTEKIDKSSLSSRIRRQGNIGALTEAEQMRLTKALDVRWELVYRGVYKKDFSPHLDFPYLFDKSQSALKRYKQTNWTFQDTLGNQHRKVPFETLHESWLKGELLPDSLVQTPGKTEAALKDYDSKLLFDLLNQRSVLITDGSSALSDQVKFYNFYRHELSSDKAANQALANCRREEWKIQYANGEKWRGSFDDLKKLWLSGQIDENTLIAKANDSHYKKIYQNEDNVKKALEIPMELIAEARKIHVPHKPISNVLVKPFLENLQIFEQLLKQRGPETVETCLYKMNEDSWHRAFLTINLQMMDLHSNNIGFTPIEQEAFNQFKQTQFTITSLTRQEAKQMTLFQLQNADRKNEILPTDVISYEIKEPSGRPIKKSIRYKDLGGTDLEKALKTKWQLELFDTDLSMGENNALNYHPYIHEHGSPPDRVLLPFRSSLLETNWSRTPLTTYQIEELLSQEQTHRQVLDWMNRMDAPIRRRLTKAQNEHITELLKPLLERSSYTKSYCREYGRDESMEALQTKFADTISEASSYNEHAKNLWIQLEAYLQENISAKTAKVDRPNIALDKTPEADKLRKTIAEQLFPRVTWRQREAFKQRIERQQDYLRAFQRLSAKQPLGRREVEDIIEAPFSPLTSSEKEQLLAEYHAAYDASKESVFAFMEKLAKKLHPTYTNLARSAFPLLADMQELYELYYPDKARAARALGCYKDELSDVILTSVDNEKNAPMQAKLAMHLGHRIAHLIPENPGYLM